MTLSGGIPVFIQCLIYSNIVSLPPPNKINYARIVKRKNKIKKNAKDISFWFIRHGESEGNTLEDECPVMHDSVLTDQGRKEAQKIVDYFKKNKIDISDVYTSSQSRSYQAAEIVATAFGFPLKVKNNLQERNWGEWKNLRWMEVSKNLEALTIEERYSFIPKDGESWKQMERRLFAALEEIAEENSSGENAVIVTHRGCLRAILPKLAKSGIEQHKEFSVPLGALSKFSFQKDSFDFVGLVP